MADRLGWMVVGMAVLAAACEQAPPSPLPESTPARDAFAGVADLIEQGRPDDALAQLGTAGDSPDALYYQGVAWAKKAETAPLPTPEPLPPGSPKGAVAVTPALKPEEVQALGFFDRAAAARPKEGRTHLAVATLLAPHALRRIDAERAAAAAPRRGRKGAPPALPAAAGPDHSPERVLRAYRSAVEGEPPPATAIEKMYDFAVRAGKLDDASWALQQGIERDRENPAHLVRLGDFLFQQKKDYDGAISQYRQALIWRPDDDATKAKIAEVYVAIGDVHYTQKELALAEARYAEAQKWVTNASSPTGHKVKQALEKVRAFRR